MTARRDQGERATSEGVTRVLSKPLQPESVLSTVREYCSE